MFSVTSRIMTAAVGIIGLLIGPTGAFPESTPPPGDSTNPPLPNQNLTKAVRTRSDFNGDGWRDVAIGGSGRVRVLYGSPQGLTSQGQQTWGPGGVTIDGCSPLVSGTTFGDSLAAGDFDKDGHSDLAIGDPGSHRVAILFGSSSGLTAARSDCLGKFNSSSDRFGYSLATADFDKDGYADLAVGRPDGWVSASATKAGTIQVFYGFGGGLEKLTADTWHQNSPDVYATAEEGDAFGHSLAAGDFNGDGFGDLAIGVPKEDFSVVVDGGLVHILYGSSTGLRGSGSQSFQQDTLNLGSASQTSDNFGEVLAGGDFNGDGVDDLSIGVPRKDVGFPVVSINAGAVYIIYGSQFGLSVSGRVAPVPQFLYQSGAGLPGTPEASDYFGAALAAGDLNGDGREDLAIGVPGQDVVVNVVSDSMALNYASSYTADNAGVVHVLYGGVAGLGTVGSRVWHQNSSNVPETVEAGDRFGSALFIANVGFSGVEDLAIGVADEELTNGGTPEGGLHVLYGSSTGLTASGTQFWPGSAQGRFGSSLPGSSKRF
jgi:hypothetical protein